MDPADLTYETDERYFVGQDAGIEAAILAWEEDDGARYGCALRPGLPAEAKATALEWFARLVTRIEECGLSGAVELDGWQRRSDGKYQLLGRRHELPSLD